jgi:hypothetical protein
MAIGGKLSVERWTRRNCRFLTDGGQTAVRALIDAVSPEGGLRSMCARLREKRGSAPDRHVTDRRAYTGEDRVGRRESPREALAIVCQARQANGTWLRASLRDVSIHGFQITWFPKCRTDLPVWIRLPNLAPLAAEVRWKSGNAIGCQFAQPLHPAVFDHLIREAKRQAPRVPGDLWSLARE